MREEGDGPHGEEICTTEDIVAPLVGAVDEGTDETTDDEGNTHEQGGHDVGEREAGGEEDGQEEEREGDEPLDVPDILQRQVSKAA